MPTLEEQLAELKKIIDAPTPPGMIDSVKKERAMNEYARLSRGLPQPSKKSGETYWRDEFKKVGTPTGAFQRVENPKTGVVGYSWKGKIYSPEALLAIGNELYLQTVPPELGGFGYKGEKSIVGSDPKTVKKYVDTAKDAYVAYGLYALEKEGKLAGLGSQLPVEATTPVSEATQTVETPHLMSADRGMETPSSSGWLWVAVAVGILLIME